jgi:hypothetical protein
MLLSRQDIGLAAPDRANQEGRVMWATDFTRDGSGDGRRFRAVAMVDQRSRQANEVTRRAGLRFRGLRCLLDVTVFLALAAIPVLAGGDALEVRRHIAPVPSPCALVAASPEYAELESQAQRLIDGTPDERAAANLYLSGLDQSDPTVLGGIHNLTVHRVFAPLFCHAYLGLDRAIGVTMLWAGLKAHDGINIAGPTLWGRWLGGYQLSQAVAAYQLLARDDDGRMASSPFNEIPGMLTRAIGDFADANDSPVHTAPADLLVDTRFEDNALNFVGWAFVASFWATQGDVRQMAKAITKAEEFWVEAFRLEHFCWIPEGLPPEDLTSSQCRQDVAALLEQEAAHEQGREAVPPPRIAVFNHDRENPYYGVGILNNMARAVQILRDLGAPPLAGPPEFRAVVAGIYRWAQSHVRADGAYASPSDGPGAGCLVAKKSGDGSWVVVDGGRAVRAYCGDDTPFGGYSPKQEPLRGFFSLVGGYPSGAADGYRFSEFDPRTDVENPDTGARHPFFRAIWSAPQRFVLDNGRLVFNGVFGDELVWGR